MDLNLPNEIQDREMYHFAQDFLKEKGFHQYEISNFAKEGKESVHNNVYWIREITKALVWVHQAL